MIASIVPLEFLWVDVSGFSTLMAKRCIPGGQLDLVSSTLSLSRSIAERKPYKVSLYPDGKTFVPRQLRSGVSSCRKSIFCKAVYTL